MKAISLDAYSLKVRSRRDSKTLNLDLFDGKHSLLAEFTLYLSTIDNSFFDSKIDSKCLTADSIASNQNNLFGIAHIGEYGYEGRLVNPQSGLTSYNRQKNDAPLEPFFFQIHVPANSKIGILICAKHGQSGCKAMLERYLRQSFESKYPGYIIDINPLMPKQAIDALVKKGRLSAVRFVQNIIPSDIADRLNGNQKSQEGEVEIIVRPKKNGFLSMDRIWDVYNKTKKLSDVMQIKDFEPDNLKIEIDVDGRKRIIDFGNLNRVRASFDITGEVEPDSSGYPTFNSIKKSSEQLVISLIKSL